MKLLSHFQLMHQLMSNMQATHHSRGVCSLDEVYHWFKERTEYLNTVKGKLIFIGNGGSASICSHMAIDYAKNGHIAAHCFNDGSLLTCLGNDLGFENIFANALKLYANPHDLLVAISSSGNSKNIINAVEYAKDNGMSILTLSGFQPQNSLRTRGDYNIYTPSYEYGYVEISHLHFCHAMLDLMIEEQSSLLPINKPYVVTQLDKGVRL